MKAKLLAIFDNRVTWMGIGSMAGMLFGDKVQAAVGAFGVFVMTVI